MELLSVMIGVLALALGVAAGLLWRMAHAARLRAMQLEIELASSAHYAKSLSQLREELTAEQQARMTAEKEQSALTQKIADMQEHLQQKEKLIDDFKQAARASVLQAGQELSSKLLEDHKREAKLQREQQEQFTQKATQSLLENVGQLSKNVAAISAQSDHNKQQMETVMRALTNPAGAGQMSEIGLENSLKALGLVAGQDFFMQYHIEAESGGKLRPDVVVLLPQDMVMVIDSKASQFLVKLAAAQDTAEEAVVMQQFIASTRQHVAELARKQYADEVAAMLRKKGRRMGFMMNAMYINSDAAIEKLRMADAGLSDLCEKHGLFLIGPAGLSATFSLARQQIAAAKRDENQQQIIEQLRVLMGNLATTLGYVDGVGKNIQQASKKFGDFAKSMNRSVLPKLRQMEQMGVEPAKNKSLPRAIAYFDVIDHADTITAEATEMDSPELLALESESA